MAKKAADLFQFAHEHRDEIVWMSQNTNTIPLDVEIEEAMIASVQSGEYHLYPYHRGIFGLREAILEDLSLDEYDVLLTNGGIEALYAAQRALLSEGEEVIGTDPSFLPIHRQTEMSKARVVEVPIYGDPWKLTSAATEVEIREKTRALLVINPHNPVGSGYAGTELRALADLARDHGLYLFHDVTYRDFDENHSLATEYYPEKTLTFYSFSKGPGMAGLRVGGLVGPSDLVERVRFYNTNVLGVNVVAQRGALAALRTKKRWLPKLRSVCTRNQDVIRKAVESVDGAHLPVYPSKSNSFIVDLQEAGVDSPALEEQMLLEHRVHVRAGTYLSPRFGRNFVRVSFSVTPEDCDRFPEAFTASMEALRN